MAARCGDDAVRLQPRWPAVIAATRFARSARWRFGNRAATLTYLEPRPKRWLTQRAAADPVQIRFDLRQWGSAYARCDGHAREIDVFATDGSAIAAVRLENVDAPMDELLWRLADDDQRLHAATAREAAAHRCCYSRHGALAAGALHHALIAAGDAALPLQLVLVNAGGSVAWSPQLPIVSEAGDATELSSALGSVLVGDRCAGICTARLNGGERGEPRLDVFDERSVRALTVELGGAATPLQRLAWRSICAALPANRV